MNIKNIFLFLFMFIVTLKLIKLLMFNDNQHEFLQCAFSSFCFVIMCIHIWLTITTIKKRNKCWDCNGQTITRCQVCGQYK